MDDPRARRTPARSRQPPTARSRTCRCCSGRSASWSAAASISSRCSRYSFWLASDARARHATAGICKLALWSLPLPWLAIELGWVVAEYGRQPWAIEGVLPTALGVSSVIGRAGRDEPGRIRAVLHRARDRRCDPDGALCAQGSRRARHVARSDRRRHAPRASRRSALRSTACSTTKRLRVIWWLLLGMLLIGFAVMDGFDLGVAALVRVLGHDDDERRCVARNGRAGLGRQPGLDHPRRRRGVRRVAVALCRFVLRVLFRDPARAARLHPAAGRLRLPQQDRRMRAGATAWDGR